jgi:membrane protein
LVLAILLILLGPTLHAVLSTILPVHSAWLKTEPFLHWFLAALFTFGGIEFTYLLAPNLPIAKRFTVPGALVAAAIWMGLSWGLGFYFHNFGLWKLEQFYGVLATPIAFVVWLYWSAAAVLIGAQINLSLMQYKLSRRVMSLESGRSNTASEMISPRQS